MQNDLIMYVGCFTTRDRGGNGTGGIGVFRSRNGKPFERIQTAEQFNPSFLALSEDKRFLYGVQGKGQEIYAYAVNEQEGTLSFLNSVHAGPGLAIEVCNGYLYAVAGTVQIYQLLESGFIGPRVAELTPEGETGPIPSVQKSAQPHHILHDTNRDCFAVPCRGMDVVHLYRYVPETQQIKAVSELHTYGGFYPRHIAFHPVLPVAYQLLERFGLILACRYENGTLIPFETLPSVSPDFVGSFNAAGEIFVHPNGKLLAVSNRGENSIGMFRIHEDGGLSPIGWTKDNVSIPRFFTFDETGARLFCANIGQCPLDRPISREGDAIPGTGDITVFHVDQETGCLTFTGERIAIPAPSCILFKTL